jgi:DNA-binding NarL/FixJ family response regulator
MAQGLNNNQIAEHLFISLSTVKFHVSNVLWKLGAFSRTEAVSLAIKKGLIK